MITPFMWIGAALTALGFIVLLAFVVPNAGSTHATTTAPDGRVVSASPSPLAVAVAGFGLAGGLVLLGIGFGKWRRPAVSATDGYPEA